MMLRLGVLLLLVFTSAGCDHAPAPTAPSSIPLAPVTQPRGVTALQGTVHDTAGKPLEGVVVGAWSGPEAYGTTDANGNFTITCCAEAFVGTDTFAAYKPGYVTATRTLASGLHFVLAPAGTSPNSQ